MEDELPVWIPVGKVGEEEEIFLYTFLEFTVSKNQNKVTLPTHIIYIRLVNEKKISIAGGRSEC